MSFDDLAITKRGDRRNIEERNGEGGNRREQTHSPTRKYIRKKLRINQSLDSE